MMVIFVEEGVAPLSFPDQGADFPIDLGVFHKVLQHILGNHGEEEVFLQIGQGLGLAVDEIIHQVAGHVVAAEGDIVAGTALTDVHLEDLELSVPLIVLEIEVRKAHIVEIFQEVHELRHHLFIESGDEGGVVADGRHRMLLENHLGIGDELGFSLLIGIIDRIPHVGIIAGDVVLDDEIFPVAAGGDLLNHLVDFFQASQAVNLLGAFKGMLVVFYTVAGLNNHRVAHLLGKGRRVLAGVIEGCRGINAVLFAELVEVFLHVELVHEIFGDVVHEVAGLQNLLVLNDEPDIGIVGAHKDQGFSGFSVALGHVQKNGGKGGGFVEILMDLQSADDGAQFREGQHDTAHNHGFDAVFLMEGNGHIVCINISSDDDGDEGMFHNEPHFVVFQG